MSEPHDSHVGAPPGSGGDAEGSFRARLPVRLGYEALARRALERLARSPIRVERALLRGRVEVPTLEIGAVGERLELRASLRARFGARLLDADAKVRLRGAPVLEPGGRLRVEGLELVAEETSSSLLRGLLALSRPLLRDALERALRLDLTERLERLRGQAAARLAAVEVAPGVRLRGGLEGLELGSLRVEDEALVVVALVRGWAEVELRDEPALEDAGG